jgi:fatty acid desaturase
MNTITKEQIQQFTPEQQAAVATMALRRVQKHERLLKQARQSRRSIFATAAMLALAYGVAVFQKAPPLLQLGVFVLAMAIMIQSIAINRRLDAMLELFEDDHDA